MTYQPKTKQVQRDAIKQFFAATKSGGAQWWTDEVSAAVVDDLAACEAALAEEQARHQWRDIETAPKDGTLLLGWWAGGMQGKGIPFILTWAKWLDGSKDGVMCWMDFEHAWPREPMFWQPLPQPPERSV